jgi:hypothetical protein
MPEEVFNFGVKEDIEIDKQAMLMCQRVRGSVWKLTEVISTNTR